jgi:hypothetical protein
MTEARPPRPTRRLKTWSSLGQLGRIPSEYEIVTHNLNYTTRPNRTSARRWVARWTPRAEAAAAGLSQLFKQSPSGVCSAQTVENAANSAWHRLLNEAGLAG